MFWEVIVLGVLGLGVAQWSWVAAQIILRFAHARGFQVSALAVESVGRLRIVFVVAPNLRFAHPA
jgi:hypothetical protein